MAVKANSTGSQFLRELHFIEAPLYRPVYSPVRSRSSFGNCTSLRLSIAYGPLLSLSRSSFGNCTSLRRELTEASQNPCEVAVPSGTALH